MWRKIPIRSVWLLASFPPSSTVTVMAQQVILSKYWLTADLDSISSTSTTESQDDSSINSDSSTESESLIKLGVVFFGLVVNSMLHYGISTYDKTPYHTSALTGEMWVLELLNGHPECICSELGVHKHVFRQIIKDLHQSGHQDSKIITLEEQLSIFLYTCVTGLSIRHVSKCFQHATEMMSWYVKSIYLSILSIDFRDIVATFLKCLLSFHRLLFTLNTSNLHAMAIPFLTTST